MSQPFSRTLHPFDLAHRPRLEPEVERATLAALALIGSTATERSGKVGSASTKRAAAD